MHFSVQVSKNGMLVFHIRPFQLTDRVENIWWNNWTMSGARAFILSLNSTGRRQQTIGKLFFTLLGRGKYKIIRYSYVNRFGIFICLSLWVKPLTLNFCSWEKTHSKHRSTGAYNISIFRTHFFIWSLDKRSSRKTSKSF